MCLVMGQYQSYVAQYFYIIGQMKYHLSLSLCVIFISSLSLKLSHQTLPENHYATVQVQPVLESRPPRNIGLSAFDFAAGKKRGIMTNILSFLDNYIRVSRYTTALPPKLIAGEIHYSRIPVEYWQHRLQTVRSMGFNALSVYIMWNYHEISKGKFDYATYNKNLTLFLQLAKKYKFYVLIRPGPYVCAEWDFGGFPARLLNVQGIKLRANNAVYLAQVKEYFASLVPILTPFLAANGGPIILLQIENQYGFYGSDKTYIESLRAMWRDLGVVSKQYYVYTVYNIYKCHWSGANIGINNGNSQVQYIYARILQGKGLLFGGEIYSGWLTHWGQDFQGKNMTQYLKQFSFLFNKNHSFSMYMVHGGSNFGLTAGANAKNKGGDYEGHITSYDYDAPIDEQGSTNEKFTAFRELAMRFVDWSVPQPPAPLPVVSIPAFKPFKIAALFGNLPTPTISKSSATYLFETSQLEMYNQGFVVYETTLSKNTHTLKMVVHDFAVVYLDGGFIGSFDRAASLQHSFNVTCGNTTCKLFILVEAMGHINFDHQMETDRKGLVSFSDSKDTKFQWNIYKINVDQNILAWRNLSERNFPSLSRANFTLETVGDTFINVKNYKKGYVWVNGRNLGRYWNIGPSQKLFCPGVWLKKGQNDLFILDMLTDDLQQLTGDKTLK